MLRALIAAVILAAAAHAMFGAPIEEALGYSLVGSILVWLLLPVLRVAVRHMRRARKRRGRRPTPRQGSVAMWPPEATVPSLTQINHHHYYCHHAAAPTAAVTHWLDPDVRGLPQHGQRKAAHDAVYNTIDVDD